MFVARGRSTVIVGGTDTLTIKEFEKNFPSVSDVIIKKNSTGQAIYPTEVYTYVIKTRDPSMQSKLIPIESGLGRMINENTFERLKVDNTYKDGIYNDGSDGNPLYKLDIPVNTVIEIVGYNLSEVIYTRLVNSNTSTTPIDKILSNDTSNNVIITVDKDTALEGLIVQQLNTGPCQVSSGTDVIFIDLSSGEIVDYILTKGPGQQILLAKTAKPNTFIVSNSSFSPINQALYTNIQSDLVNGVLGTDAAGLGVYPSGDKIELGYEISPVRQPAGFPWNNNILNIKRKKFGKIVSDFDPTKLIPNYTNVWYVDPINGVDATAIVNNRNLPLLNLSTALAKNESNPFAIVIIGLTDDYVARGLKSFNGVQPTRSVAIFVEGNYRYISVRSSSSIAPIWALTSGQTQVYETTIAPADCNNVVDFSIKLLPTYVDNEGRLITVTKAQKSYRPLVKVNSIAQVAETAGTWYNDGTKTYVRAHDSRNLIGSNRLQPLSVGNNFRFPNSQDNTVIYVKGVDFVGGAPVSSGPIQITATGGASGGNTINTASTSGLVTGMEVSGVGINNAAPVGTIVNNASFQITGTTLSVVASGNYLAYFKNNTLILDNCSIQMSNLTLNGLSWQLPGTVYQYNTWTYNNGRDGTNYRSPQADGGIITGSSPLFAELFCGAKGNGSTGSSGPSDSPISVQDRTVGISLGCIYVDSADRVILNSDYCKHWILDSIVGQAIRSGSDKESIAATGLVGQYTWLDTVTVLNGSNPKWVAKETAGDKATLYYYNSGTVTNSPGNTGNVIEYVG